MFKKLCAETKQYPLNRPSFYRLEDLHSYLTGTEWSEQHNAAEYYKKSLRNLSDGLPNKKHKSFGEFNLSKVYKTDILNIASIREDSDYYNLLTRFDWIASGHKEKIIFCDSLAFTTNDLHKKNSKIRLIDDISKNYKYDKYTEYLENIKGFGDFTVASTVFPNVVTINKNNTSPVSFEYCNSIDDPILESNTNIVDIKANSNVNLNEIVRLQAAQLNYVVYILRENSTLTLERNTYAGAGSWSIFDSVFICYPGSTLNIKTRNHGSHYTAENFYIEGTEDVTVDIQGRNEISKGNDYHSEVFFETKSKNNSCNIDIRTVGNEHTNTSFVGTYQVDENSTGFVGNMFNKNIMLDSSSLMRSRPQLDIKTKEIECAHGCTISNVDESALYYLQSKGLSSDRAKKLLVESFLC